MVWRRLSVRSALSAFVMIFLGTSIAYQSKQYEIGSLVAMEAGFIPYYCGVLLVVLGAFYLFLSYFSGDDEGQIVFVFKRERIRGWLFILFGMAAFVIFGDLFGFFVGSFLLIFVSSIGSTEFNYKSSLWLALGVTVVGAFIFLYLLDLQMPMFQLGF